MESTDGLHRGMEVLSTGSPISVPVGLETLGRIFNVLGQAIDGEGEIKNKVKSSIHRGPPEFKEQSTQIEILENRNKGY